MPLLTLQVLEDIFDVHRLPPQSIIPKEVFSLPIYFIAKTHDELSLVIPQHLQISSEKSEKDWQVLKVLGPLDFSLTGILANISTVLAKESISIFALSTFDTDYILVKSSAIDAAVNALKQNDYQII